MSLSNTGAATFIGSALAEAAPHGGGAHTSAHVEEAPEKAPPVIDIDGTVLIQFGLFVIMYVVLRTFLFGPYMKMRAERDKQIGGAEAKAKGFEHEREALEKSYKDNLQRARQTADEERAKLQNEGRNREAELLAQARSRAQEKMRATQQTIDAQVATAKVELEKRAETLSHVLATKLLGREV